MTEPLTEKNHVETEEPKEQKTDLKMLYLHKIDIEAGGPQPRNEILRYDPETVALLESIKENGQEDPIDVYPSPLGNGKYRIVDGHRRKCVCFDILYGRFPGGPGMWAICNDGNEKENYERAAILDKVPISKVDKSRFCMTMMEKFPEAYPTLDAFRKLNVENLESYVATWKKIDALGGDISSNQFFEVERLSPELIRPISSAPKTAKSAIISAVLNHNLSMGETQKLVKVVQGLNLSNPEDIDNEAKKIKEHKIELPTEKQLELAAQFLSKDERLRIFKKFLKQLKENPIYEVTPERQAARFLQVSDQIVYQWVRKQKVPAIEKTAKMLNYLIEKNPGSVSSLIKNLKKQIFEIHCHLNSLVS